MNVLRPEKKLAVVSALVEGVSIRSIERMTGVHRDTIMRLTVRVGERCSEIMDETMRNLRCRYVQVDEIWTYVRKKQARLAFTERHSAELGDQYVFVALDADTKLVPHFEVGKRNMVTAYRMMDTLKARLAVGFQLTTDGFVPYIGAVDRAWGADAPDFAQLVKIFNAAQSPGAARYSPPMLAEAVPAVVWGNPDPAHISTSYVERQNHDQDGLPEVHPADKRLLEETRQPQGRAGAALRALQPRADSQQPARDPRDGRRRDRSGMGRGEASGVKDVKPVNLAILCATILIAAVVFWPTLYRYDTQTISGYSFPVRMHRLTGHTETFRAGAWVPEQRESVTKKLVPIPREELGKLEGAANLHLGLFTGELYNGGSWIVKQVRFAVVAKSQDGRILWRRSLIADVSIEPLRTGHFSIITTHDRDLGGFDWGIEEGQGYQP